MTSGRGRRIKCRQLAASGQPAEGTAHMAEPGPGWRDGSNGRSEGIVEIQPPGSWGGVEMSLDG